MRLIGILALLSVLTFQLASQACLNDIDSDTLANQAKGLPDVVQVITGRFARNPPIFYEMRIARVQKELRLNPSRLPLYDDIGVALDRVGRDDEAIAWMKQKKAQLDKLSGSNPTSKQVVHEQLYRYHANLGTFIAHRWLRAGAERTRLAEVKTARSLIAQAIHLKPDAHFGREKYQLMAMEWILAPHGTPLEKSGYHLYYSLASYMWGGFVYGDGGLSKGVDSSDDKRGGKGKIEGLSGLIVLGNAWESVDIYDALGQALGSYDTQPVNDKKFSVTNAVTLQCLAKLRCQELIEQSRRPLFATAATQAELIPQWAQCSSSCIYPKNIRIIEGVYRRLRKEAEQWQARRAMYMMVRLKAGRHPDTDPRFWSGWTNGAPPSLNTGEHWQTFEDEKRELTKATSARRQSLGRTTALMGGSLVLLTILIGGLWRLHTTRRAKIG